MCALGSRSCGVDMPEFVVRVPHARRRGFITSALVRRSPVFVAALAVVAVALPVLAVNHDGVDVPARGVEPAVRATPVATDVVTVYNSGPLKSDVAANAYAATAAAGGTGAIGRAVSTGMQRVRRGSTLVQEAAPGWAYPMGTTILPTELVAGIMGFDVSAVLSPTVIVMSRRTADLRGAQQGDVVDLVASSGAVVSFTIGAVVDDAVTGGTELLLSTAAGDRLEVNRQSRIVLWGFDSRAAIDAQLAAHNLVSTSIRIRRSWDAPDPDSTLGMARTKELLGEFAYSVNSSGSVSIDSTWRAQNITSGSIGRLRLSSGCHNTVRAALTNAMNEVITAGLEYSINYDHANTYGGCYVPRFNRLTPNSTIGFLSRHSWGMAVDTNTVGSCQGCAPPDMNCQTVRIFRKHGFAWGGNYLTPDGMHFEWVGEQRDLLPYPSRYCANSSTGALELPGEGAAEYDVTQTSRATMFADDGLVADG